MDDKRTSRREMLRNIGLAGAATWAAPVLTSRASASVDRCTKKRARKLCGYQQGYIACNACDGAFHWCGTCSSDVGVGVIARKIADAGVNIEALYLAHDNRNVLVSSDNEAAREALAMP
jgi:predicted PP-loop superfamily ATPase